VWDSDRLPPPTLGLVTLPAHAEHRGHVGEARRVTMNLGTPISSALIDPLSGKAS
jgi:hypothetical protein